MNTFAKRVMSRIEEAGFCVVKEENGEWQVVDGDQEGIVLLSDKRLGNLMQQIAKDLNLEDV